MKNQDLERMLNEAPLGFSDQVFGLTDDDLQDPDYDDEDLRTLDKFMSRRGR